MYMANKMCWKAYVLFILLALMVKLGFAEWSPISKGTLKFPANAFKVFGYADSPLNGTIIWQGDVDIHISIFEVNKNLLNKDLSIRKYLFQPIQLGYFSFRPPYNGQYVILAQPGRVNNLQANSIPFTFKLVSDTLKISSAGEIHRYNFYGALLNTPTSSPNRLRFTSDSQQTKNVLLYSKQKQIIFSQNNQICINDSSFFNSKLLIKYTPAAIYDIITVNYTFQSYSNQNCRYQCFNNFALNFNCSPSNQRSILPIIIPLSAVSAVLIVIVAIIVYKKCSKRKQKQETKEESKKKESNIEGSLARIVEPKQIPSQCCCICLATNCNSSLPCRHIFHRACIQQWMMKNKNCPICRYQIIKSMII